MTKEDKPWIDLTDLDLGEIEILSEEGGRGIPEFAASTGTGCNASGSCSCNTITDGRESV